MTELFDHFSRPWLGILLFLPLLLLIKNRIFPIRKAALIYSDISRIEMPKTLRLRLSFIPALLYLLTWFFMVIALMGPRKGDEKTKITTQGIAISMVMDVSASMNEKDMPISHNTLVTRYDMVEKVFSDFVRGNEKLGLNGRPNDMISLVIFGQYVDELSPLTLDHDVILDHMQDTMVSVKAEINKQQRNRQSRPQGLVWGTAIYEGVAWGADMLKNTTTQVEQAEKKGQSNYNIKSKILILLSDGEDTGSTITNEEAIKVAKEYGVKIYAIAIHGQPVQSDIFGFQVRGQKYDDAPLKLMASETGGKFYEATSPDSLAKIYQDIDELEKTEIQREISMEFSPTHRIWLQLSLAFFCLAILLQNTFFRVLA